MDYPKEARKNYNLMAESYHRTRTNKKTNGWFYNEWLEMPTTLKLLGNVKGKKILDMGCGTGLYARILKQRGAHVYGIDISEGMLAIARREVPGVVFVQGNAEKLPYNNKSFDIVLAALMLEYFPSWENVFKEVRRVLKPRGIFIFSMGNPVMNASVRIMHHGKKIRDVQRYFHEGLHISQWDVDDKKVPMKWHHKTYSTVIKNIVKHQFTILDYEDAKPLPQSKKYFPEHYEKCVNKPIFCTWKVQKR